MIKKKLTTSSKNDKLDQFAIGVEHGGISLGAAVVPRYSRHASEESEGIMSDVIPSRIESPGT